MDFRLEQLRKLRTIPRPEDGLRLLVDRAPQAEAWAERVMIKARPALTWLYGARRRMATALVAGLTVWMFAHVMLGANGMVVYRQKSSEYKDLQKDIDRLQKENASYTQYNQALRTDPDTIEKEAREQLGYTKRDEVVFVTPRPTPPPPPANSSARK